MKALVHRLLRSDERALLQSGWQALEPFVLDHSDERRRRRYFHLYKHGHSSDALPAALSLRILDFARELCQELAVAGLVAEGDVVTHFGYQVNAPGAPAQDWHVDYDGDLISVYIPLTRETERNATQYLQGGDGYCLSVQFLSRGADELPIIYNPRRGVHRGIDNAEWYTRTVFYFYITKADWKNREPVFEKETRLAVNVDILDVTERPRPETPEPEEP
jgi:hypothetical protein